MAFITETARRVPDNTDPDVAARLDRKAEEMVTGSAAAGPHSIEARLKDLDREWDVERVIQAEAATMALAGLALGAKSDRRFFAMPGVVAGMMLLHALHGWYPLLPVFRRMGFRTPDEINAEREALRRLRGDRGAGIPDDAPTQEKVEAARAAWRAVKG